jgi:two-component system chemotaxis response regulator CheY
MKLFLVVDDSPVIRKVADRILGDLGFSVVEAGDGFQGLESVRNQVPEVVLVDWDLGGMSGLEFLEEFNRVPGTNECKVFFCTSEIIIPEMTKAKRLGVDGFLMKPFNREIMIHKLLEAGLIEPPEQAA